MKAGRKCTKIEPLVRKEMPFAVRFCELISEKNLTHAEIAESIDVARQTIGKWCSGESAPDIIAAGKLADFFNVSVDYLLGRTNLRNVYKDKSALIGDVEKLQSEIKKRSDALQQALGDARLYAEGIGLILHEFGQERSKQ